jgi:hypothetical protein
MWRCAIWCAAFAIMRRAISRRCARDRTGAGGDLAALFRDVDRANLGINFDPANMILYGTGDPTEALGFWATRDFGARERW